MLPIFSNIKISRFVVISGILTFLYLIELCIGARTVYYVFNLWNNPSGGTSIDAKVSWTLCVACLLTAAASSFIVNFISALWEQKQIKEEGKEKSVFRFAMHLLAGGMLWRYVTMWFSDNEDNLKIQALLLTMAKFLFTHFFTIPLVIIHTSLLSNLEELIYDVCSVLCISLNLLLTCIVFSWGKKLVSDLKKWNYETIDLVPLIFSQSFLNEIPTKEKNSDFKEKNSDPKEINSDGTTTKNKDISAQEQTIEIRENFERTLVRLAVLLQTSCFSFGRLLALGILLKLAGVYAISIMFLQLLASVIYLKFQVPILVSDSLQKWRQLTRLAFMSYILIFEWHLNRDSSTGYDFDSNIKHSILYYSIATIESVFYLVTWAVTTSFSNGTFADEYEINQAKFSRLIIVIGSLTLVFSLTMHLILIMWRSRRLSTLVYSVKRQYACFKMSINRNTGADKNDVAQKKQIEISHPVHVNNLEKANCSEEDGPGLNKHNSYRDLREPLDDEIEIYSRDKKAKIASISEKKVDSPAKTFAKMQQRASSSEDSRKSCANSSTKEIIGKNELISDSSTTEANGVKVQTPDRVKKSFFKLNRKKELSRDASIDETDASKTIPEKTEIPDAVKVIMKNDAPIEQSKLVVLSETFSGQWNKLSLASQKFSGTIREHFQKRRTQLKMFRNGSTEKPNTEGKKGSKKRKLNGEPPNDEPPKQFIGEIYSNEGYFVGDEEGHEEDVCYSADGKEDINWNGRDMHADEEDENHSSVEIESLKDVAEDVIEPAHCSDSESCPCFVCKSDEIVIRRRRSSSVPPQNRKKFPKSEVLPEQKVLSRYLSSPIIYQNENDIVENNNNHEKNGKKLRPPSPDAYTIKRIQNLSLMSLDRIEHYV